MDLAVAGDLLALAIKDDCRVVIALLAVDRLHDRAGVDEDAVLDRLAPRHFISRAAGQPFGGGELFGARAARPVELFGQEHPVRALFGDRPLDQSLGRSQCWRPCR